MPTFLIKSKKFFFFFFFFFLNLIDYKFFDHISSENIFRIRPRFSLKIYEIFFGYFVVSNFFVDYSYNLNQLNN